MKKIRKLFKKLKRKSPAKMTIVLIALGIFITFAVIVAVIYAQKTVEEQKRVKQYETITYAEYQQLLENGDIDTVCYNEDNDYMYISLHNDLTRNMTIEEREEYESPIEECKKVYYPGGEDFRKNLVERGVLVMKTANFGQNWDSIGQIFYWAIIIVFMLLMMRKMNPAKGSALTEIDTEDLDITFKDVIGHEEVKEDLKHLIRQIKKNGDFSKITQGILFEGSTGTGKTTLARAFAKEAGFNFISVDCSRFVDTYVGVGAKRVREAFEKAREKPPCIIFFDEIDAIGTTRGNGRSTQENDTTLNEILINLDGFQKRDKILVIAATNRVADLDKALIREGRFDRTICIGIPTRWETRQDLFNYYLSEFQLDKSVDTESLAKQTIGYSQAKIAGVCRTAFMVMCGNDREVMTQEDIEEAIDKIIFRGNRSQNVKKETMEIVAYHEAGHAVMNLYFKRPIARVSIMGMTSNVGGGVFQSDEDKMLHTKRDIEIEIHCLYAGRASEEIKYGADNVTDSASADINEATNQIKDYFAHFGFGNNGVLNFDALAQNKETMMLTMGTMIDFSNKMYAKTIDILREHYGAVETLAQKLLEAKTLSGSEVDELNLFGNDDII